MVELKLELNIYDLFGPRNHSLVNTTSELI